MTKEEQLKNWNKLAKLADYPAMPLWSNEERGTNIKEKWVELEKGELKRITEKGEIKKWVAKL